MSLSFPVVYTQASLQEEMERLLVPGHRNEVAEQTPTTLESTILESASKLNGLYSGKQRQIPTDGLDLINHSMESAILHVDSKSICLNTGKLSTKLCVLCKSNGETPRKYTSHCLKDNQGRVTCPVLFGLTCKHCGATGYKSHTEAYCPVTRKRYIDQDKDRPPVLGVILKQTKRNSTGVRRDIN